jgi:hypothetical protein
MPTPRATTSAATSMSELTALGQPAKAWMSAMPNYAATSLRRAPRARRIPTSRVRSATLASIMFMIPIPPTSRLTLIVLPTLYELVEARVVRRVEED